MEYELSGCSWFVFPAMDLLIVYAHLSAGSEVCMSFTENRCKLCCKAFKTTDLYYFDPGSAAIYSMEFPQLFKILTSKTHFLPPRITDSTHCASTFLSNIVVYV